MSAAETHNPASVSARKPLWRRAWPLGVLALSAGVAFYVTWQTWHGHLPNGGLIIDDKYLDLGEAWYGSKFSWKLLVHNTTSSPVKVLGFATSCGCASIKETPAFTLAPGEVHELEVTIDLALILPPCDKPNAKVWPFKLGVMPLIKGAEVRQQGWIMHGKIKRLLVTSPPAVYFGENLVRGRSLSPATVKVKSTAPLERLLVQFDKKQLEVTVSGKGKDFAINVQPKADLPPGRFAFTIQLQPTLTNQTLPGTPVLVEGFVHEEIEAFPKRLLLGALPLGESRTETIFFNSMNGIPFALDHWKCSFKGADIRLASRSSKDHQPAACCITQRIVKEGEQKGRALFVMRSENGRMVRVPVDIVYYGLASASGPER